jgi:hypothetical protein
MKNRVYKIWGAPKHLSFERNKLMVLSETSQAETKARLKALRASEESEKKPWVYRVVECVTTETMKEW